MPTKIVLQIALRVEGIEMKDALSLLHEQMQGLGEALQTATQEVDIHVIPITPHERVFPASQLNLENLVEIDGAMASAVLALDAYNVEAATGNGDEQAGVHAIAALVHARDRVQGAMEAALSEA